MSAMSAKQTQSAIPDKLYFKIGEVAKIIGVKPYVLRYWETEFPDIAPGKSKTNQRLYKRKEVERILQIKELLYREKYTIEGARKRLKSLARGGVEKLEELNANSQMPLFDAGKQKDFLKLLKGKLEDILGAIKH